MFTLSKSLHTDRRGVKGNGLELVALVQRSCSSSAVRGSQRRMGGMFHVKPLEGFGSFVSRSDFGIRFRPFGIISW